MDAQNTNNEQGQLLLSDNEKRVLELHDRLQQLQLEIALLTAQKNYTPDSSTSTSLGSGGGDDSAAIPAAQKALLESRSRYILRNNVVDSVVTANPILQAVHNGTKAGPIERDLAPLIRSRDAASSTLAEQSTTLRTVLDELTSTESQSLQLSRENIALASRMLDLAQQADWGKTETTAEHPDIERLEDTVRRSRQRWRVMKGTASAVVAGSGVDWARDAELRDVVLDAEGDED